MLSAQSRDLGGGREERAGGGRAAPGACSVSASALHIQCRSRKTAAAAVAAAAERGTSQRGVNSGAGKKIQGLTDEAGSQSLRSAASPRPPPLPSSGRKSREATAQEEEETAT